MARKVVFTKDELQRQQRELAKYRRFLPTLQLKKQQLQVEVRDLIQRTRSKRLEMAERLEELREWVGLFAVRDAGDWRRTVRVREVHAAGHSVAGVEVREFESVDFEVERPSFLVTEPWIDRAIEELQQLLRRRAELDLMLEGIERLRRELQKTTQRVNLFEQVMIPRAEGHVRAIKIYLEDQERGAVGRAKIAKRRLQTAAVAEEGEAGA